MKVKKKALSLFLAFVMVLSLTNGWIVKASGETTDTVTVWIRVEQDEATMLPSVPVTLTNEDIRDYGNLGLSTEILTPLHVLAKYLVEKKAVAESDLSHYINVSQSTYGLWVNDIDINGSADSGQSHASVSGNALSWSFLVNNSFADTGMADYSLQSGDRIVIYGLYYGNISTYPSYFEEEEYTGTEGNNIPVTLSGITFDSDHQAVKCAISGASVYASEVTQQTTSATKENAVAFGTTDENGGAELIFTKAGTYVLSAEKRQEIASGSSINTISRPYAVVKVEANKDSKATTSPDSKTTTSPDPAATVSPDSTATAVPAPTSSASSDTVKKPGKVKNVKAVVAKKYKNKKKTVRFTWNKVSGAKGYQIYLSQKKKSAFKLKASVTGVKKSLKLKKGTYYVKVRAYNKKNGVKKTGAFSKVIKVKVK